MRWDGGNDSGGQLASGIYFAKLIAGDNVSTKKVVVLK
ncbi:MAG: T9SS type A sorting domain-containing protein [candidate division Zixibacteria bacterium]|nr:T9SS type A sorting domain-containing protein [candidate division Zixibacteria bacterium]